MTSNDLNIILFGSPGVGKGAQASLLSRREGIPHLSTGEMLREEIARGSPLGDKVKAIVERGQYVDDETMVELVESVLERPELRRGFIMDGFPRTVAQAESLERLLEKLGRRIHHAISIDASEDVILRRLEGRAVCSRCGRTYHVEFQPPQVDGVCDSCGAQVARRGDDNPDAHRKRLETFREHTRPLLDFYRREGVLSEVDGQGSIEDVADNIREVIAGGADENSAEPAGGERPSAPE